MKRNIRDLFKEEENLKLPPENHRTEFLEKLKTQNKKPSVTTWLSIAAVIIIALTIGFNVFEKSIEVEEVAPIVAQIERVEKEYLKDIETEWESFIALAEDEVLVERFRKKLNDLDKDYQEISKQFKADSNNIVVIEALVDNLQTRLQLLTDIQHHIKILNQKNEQHENTI